MRSSLPTSTRRFCTAPLATAVLVDVSGRCEAGFSCAPVVWDDLNSSVISASLALMATCSGRRFSSPSTARLAICRRTSTAWSKILITSCVRTTMLLRQRSSRSSTLCRNRASALNSSKEALPLMVCAARNSEETSSRSSGRVSSARSNCSICTRHSSVSSRNDCSSIARLISITPLQNLYLCIACIRAKHDALPSVHANNSGHHWNLRLRQCFQRHLHVSAAEVLLFSQTRFAHGIEQAASTEHLGSKLSAIGASF